MSYIANTPEQTKVMLKACGADSIEELFADIPADLAPPPLDLPEPRSEQEIMAHFEGIAGRNYSGLTNFLGGGFYDHYIPAAVDALAGRSEFYTAYTPYQPEVSQGTLQAIYEYQTQICRLTGLGASNASVYDGGTALYEACQMAFQASRKRTRIVMDRFRPGDAGIDVVHVNLHKTFATPHGCGGPGAGPVGVGEHLSPFLPISRVVRRRDNTFILDYDFPKSIGYIAPFYGNFSVCLRACAYILTLGGEGLRQASDHAVLNANYLMHNLKKIYDLPFDRTCMHEFVLSARKLLKEHDIRAADVAKGLIDQGFHPPTVYFPLIVPEAMMIEPTEVESKDTLDSFIEAMRLIAEKAATDPDSLRHAPFTTPVGRPDEVGAARGMDLAYHPDIEE